MVGSGNDLSLVRFQDNSVKFDAQYFKKINLKYRLQNIDHFVQASITIQAKGFVLTHWPFGDTAVALNQ